MSQLEKPQDTDIKPADIELIPAVGKFGRRAKSMVIVMKLLATNDNTDGHDIRAGIRAGKVSIANGMTNPINHSGRPEWNPGHLYSPNCQANQTKQGHINGQHDHDTQQRMP